MILFPCVFFVVCMGKKTKNLLMRFLSERNGTQFEYAMGLSAIGPSP